jgi:hypothetical protein
MKKLTVRLLTTPIVSQNALLQYYNPCSSVALVDKINDAKPDALLFPDEQGIINRQFSSLMLMTIFLIGIKLNSLEKTPNTIVYHESNRLGQLSLALKEVYQH